MTRAIAALILSWEPHNVPAVDTMMETVVRMERLMICVVTTVEVEVKAMRTSGSHAGPLQGLQYDFFVDGCAVVE